MPGPTAELEPVEPQSLKKLSFKSLKRALDLFSPIHGQLASPDAESKKIRFSHKVNVEYGGIKSTANQPRQQPDHSQQPGPSNALALPGIRILVSFWYAMWIIWQRMQDQFTKKNLTSRWP